MKSHWKISASISALVILGVAASQDAAAKEKILHSFSPGSYPYGRPEEDSAGNLYGTAYFTKGMGVIYQLKADRTFTKLHVFGGSDGANPVAGLTEDHLNTIFYGVTRYGGVHNAGTIFSLAPSGADWSYTVLHDFDDRMDGSLPDALLMRDETTGNLYGTANRGGAFACGTVFVLSQSGQSWNFQKIYDFQGGADGCGSVTQLQPGPKAGTLVGATTSGGSHNAGTIFELTESGDTWSEAPIYNFKGGSDGGEPFDLSAAQLGKVYGVTVVGGISGFGTVFQLTPKLGKWNYSVICNFQGGGDGSNPEGIGFDSNSGNLYGTTLNGGSNGEGTVFELVRRSGVWSKTILHNFAGRPDGVGPVSRPLIDPVTGILYGTTLGGGRNGGVVYQIAP